MTASQDSDALVGYGVFDTSEDCYEYNENACMITDSRESAQAAIQRSFSDAKDCRIDRVTFQDIMRDFGVSCGQYAMESQAFTAFKRQAELTGVTYEFEVFDGDPPLMVVQVDGVKIQDD